MSGLVGAWQTLHQETEMGKIRAAFHAPIFYLIAYREVDDLAAGIELSEDEES